MRISRLIYLILLATLLSAPAQAEDIGAPKPHHRPEKILQASKKTPDAIKETASATPEKKENTDPTVADGEVLTSQDAEEGNLPDYPLGARISIGKMETYTTGERDTFIDIARHFSLGYVELRAANIDVDPWATPPGTELVIPKFQLLPRARQKGIVVNLGKMRFYYFKDPGKPPLSFPIGIGREGLATPTGDTTIVRKMAGPTWSPTPRMRKEKPYLPATVPAGPANPLGTHALYLGWPTFLIHGSNKPWGIGRRVSSGCMRMYPEDIIEVFNMVAPGTPVTVVDQPVLVGWVDNTLYLEANPTRQQSNDIEYDEKMTPKEMSDILKKDIIETAGVAADNIDWDAVKKILHERRGTPEAIAHADGKKHGGLIVKEQNTWAYNR